jgi:hypothetical protein
MLVLEFLLGCGKDSSFFEVEPLSLVSEQSTFALTRSKDSLYDFFRCDPMALVLLPWWDVMAAGTAVEQQPIDHRMMPQKLSALSDAEEAIATKFGRHPTVVWNIAIALLPIVS